MSPLPRANFAVLSGALGAFINVLIADSERSAMVKIWAGVGGHTEVERAGHGGGERERSRHRAVCRSGGEADGAHCAKPMVSMASSRGKASPNAEAFARFVQKPGYP